MKRLAFSLVLLSGIGGMQQTHRRRKHPFLRARSCGYAGQRSVHSQELTQFAALDPIDTHTHAFQAAPALYAMLKRLNLHTLDITLVDEYDPETKDLAKERKDAWNVVHHSDGYIAFCSTFDPFKFNQPNFARKCESHNQRRFCARARSR